MTGQEKLFDAVGGIADRYISEYTAAMSPRAVKRRRTARALKYILPSLAACLCLVLLAYPILTLIFGGADSGDAGWERTHEYISVDECADLLFLRLPDHSIGESAYLFFEEGGRGERRLWNSVEYRTAYKCEVTTADIGGAGLDYVQVDAFFANYFTDGDGTASNYRTELDYINECRTRGEVIDIGGTEVRYIAHADDGYFLPDGGAGAILAEYEELYATYIKRGLNCGHEAISAAYLALLEAHHFTAIFDHAGVTYLADIYTHGDMRVLEYYLGFMIPSDIAPEINTEA